MPKLLKWVLKTNERLLIVLIIIIVGIFSIISPAFRSIQTVLNIARALIIPSISALSLLIVFIAGGVDMSFMAIASVSMYVSVKIINAISANPPLILAFFVGAVVGILLGLLNSFFVTKTKMPIFIVTLSTMFILKGATLSFIGTDVLQVPPSMVELSRLFIFSVDTADGGRVGLNISFLIVVALYLLIYLLLKYTKFGRKLYALGGDRVAATRAGINVTATLVAMFMLSGFVASIAGVLNASLLRLASAGDMIGGELPVMAAVILGGADSQKGKGSVVGTALGVLMITLINNSLNLLHIPSYWQESVLGVIIILGTLFQSFSKSKSHDSLAI